MRTPKLMECTPESLYGSLLEAAEAGVEVGVLGQAYLVPFKDNRDGGKRKSQLIYGYRGLIDLARRGGAVQNVWAEVVYEKDSFSYVTGTKQEITHTPHEGEGRGGLRATYACANLRDGGTQAVLLWKGDVEKIKRAARGSGYDDSPWKLWEEEMWKKSAIRRLCKTLPLQVEMADLIERDSARESGYGEISEDAMASMLSGAVDVVTEETEEEATEK